MTQDEALKIAKKYIGDNSKTIACYEAIKYAVNKALDEAAEKSKAWVDSGGEWTTAAAKARIDKDSIKQLKIK